MKQARRKKVLEGPNKGPKKRYLKAGSLWNRKKDNVEGKPRQRRERGGFSRNLWVFLNHLPFNYNPEGQDNQGTEKTLASNSASSGSLLTLPEPVQARSSSSNTETTTATTTRKRAVPPKKATPKTQSKQTVASEKEKPKSPAATRKKKTATRKKTTSTK